ncbi:uncharacterized protein IWZ02DRAFT_432957 [Phyllosticta citriasiana]|uniref:uncharacterized protein n=1 Tax=Phyllosticta citriasiana TaxID=595635 RepID=UPI0030FDB94D
MSPAKNQKRQSKGKKPTSSALEASSPRPEEASSSQLATLVEQVHASQQELLGRLHAENKKADDFLRRARELEAEMRAYLDKIQSSRESGTAAREPGRCYCDVEWPDASPEMLRCLHKIDKLVGVKFRPDDVGFFRHLPAPDGEDDDENEVFYRHENRSCGKCGGAINKVSGPWSRVEVFSLVSHTILAKAVAGVIIPQVPHQALWFGNFWTTQFRSDVGVEIQKASEPEKVKDHIAFERSHILCFLNNTINSVVKNVILSSCSSARSLSTCRTNRTRQSERKEVSHACKLGNKE